MFCPKCGNQLPENAKFCNSCGEKVAAVSASASAAAPTTRQYAGQVPVQKEPKKKKKVNLFVIGAVMLVFYLIGNVMGNSMADSYVPSTDQGGQTGQQSTAGNSAAYDRVFSDRNIIFAPAVFYNMDSDAYVLVESDGSVNHQQFGYRDDIVVKFVQTVYIPVDGWTEEQKQEQDAYIRSLYENTGLYFVSLTTNIGSKYYSFTLTMSDLDSTYNMQCANDKGLIIMEDEYALWGMSATEDTLLAQGYIKK